ncbi:hypothetical protein K3G63_04680 [Hymenobacter sp. HSC-4F20]|uniref:DnaT-like ssDNA-binding protein n=1 Tax=Hymenobacter sp. HSC-4F20 TaxID=2864135 RepID=UPI001C72CBD6|nr:DnaT-like ssDNA-binding protein [Hymenobacter sp. HSC-4F20]MBX0289719.1 hypothetical protein [Hymenobacter sp. HSC-4F20]
MFIAATGLNGDEANALISVEYADAYHSLRGNASWTGNDAAKQAAIIRATDYIEQVYGQRFIGTVALNTVLSWPRYTLAYDSETIPEALRKAAAELALDAMAGSLTPNITSEPQVKREKVDVLEVEYFEAAKRPTIRPAVTGYLAPLLSFSGLNVPVVRR